MARPLRIQFSGGLYHVTARGNGRQAIFTDPDDYERFTSVLRDVIARYRLLCHAYCLMGNHYHLLMETLEANLSGAMRQLNGVYAQRFSRKHERPGHVLEGRFHAQIVDKEPYLREVSRYIVLNPVRAGLVGHPRQWPWSSYRATAGEAPKPDFLTVDWLLGLGESPRRVEAERRYTRFVEAGIDDLCPTAAPSASLLLMGADVVPVPVREHIQRAAHLVDIPRAHRYALRPSLEQLFAGATSRSDRDLCIARAVREHGYSLRSIAEVLGVHYATVSRALGRVDRGQVVTMLQIKT